MEFLDQPIFVLGLPRSGTSLIAGSLKICGAWLGKTVPGGGPENPEGFFESIYLREGINKKILSAGGFDPLGISPLPPLDGLPNVNGLKQTISDFLRHEQYGFDQPWLFKEPKLTLLWPVYLKAFPKAKWIIVRRNQADVIQSCLRTSFMQQHSNDIQFWQNWTTAYEKRIEVLKQNTSQWREITPHQLIGGELHPLEELVKWCGLTWQDVEVKNFINPQYWHAKQA